MFPSAMRGDISIFEVRMTHMTHDFHMFNNPRAHAKFGKAEESFWEVKQRVS